MVGGQVPLARLNIVSDIHHLFLRKAWTLAVAESCTGGLLSATIVDCPGISSIYYGGVVSYHGSVKKNILGVSENLLKKYGEVSEPVAVAMAVGVRKKLKVKWSVSITGIAGPRGGSKEKPVGTVCFAVVGPNMIFVETKYFCGAPEVTKKKNYSRKKIQEMSRDHALKILWQAAST